MSEDGRSQTLKVELTDGDVAKAFDNLNKVVQHNESSVNRILIEIESDGPLDNTELEVNVTKSESIEVGNGEVNFERNSMAFKLANFISNSDSSWLNSGEIRRDVESEEIINLDTLSQTLWDLSERGLLEKRPCESDGRMREYKISEKGKESLTALDGE
jgi:hypothetical protein